jgi:hypothetical protein
MTSADSLTNLVVSWIENFHPLLSDGHANVLPVGSKQIPQEDDVFRLDLNDEFKKPPIGVGNTAALREKQNSRHLNAPHTF